jgi:hypothetical protein
MGISENYLKVFLRVQKDRSDATLDLSGLGLVCQ